MAILSVKNKNKNVITKKRFKKSDSNKIMKKLGNTSKSSKFVSLDDEKINNMF